MGGHWVRGTHQGGGVTLVCQGDSGTPWRGHRGAGVTVGHSGGDIEVSGLTVGYPRGDIGLSG